MNGWMKDIVKTIVDGLKDANMQVDYYKEAHEHGKNELADMHLAEACKRLDGVKEWYNKTRHHIPDMEQTAFAGVLKDYYIEWYRDLRRKIDVIKSGQ